MAQKSQQVFSRALIGEPTDHQRKFVYLPLHVFRDFTNVRSLIIENYKEKKGKHPLEFVIKRTIEKYHKQLSELNKWDELGFDKLDYIWPDSKRVDSHVWLETDKLQRKIHKKASNYEKQFIYLPLHILNAATNIRTLFSSKANGNPKHIDFFVEYMHKILGKKYGLWPVEIKDLLVFIDPSNSDPIHVAPANDVPKVNESEKSNAVASTSKAVASTSKALEIVRSPKKTVQPTRKVVIPDPVRVNRELQKSKIVPNQNKKVESPKNNNEGEQRPNNGLGKRKQVQRTLPGWLQPLTPLEKSNGSEPKLPKRRKTIMDGKKDPIASTSGTNHIHKTSQAPPISIQSNEKTNERIQTVTISANVTGQSQDNANKIVEDNESPIVSSEKSPMLIERRERNAEDRERDRESHAPSDFQREIQSLTFEDFVNKTNIKELIEKEYCEGRTNENITMSQEEMERRLKHYDEFRMRTGSWHRNAIKNLRFIECECKRKSAEKSNCDDSATQNSENITRSKRGKRKTSSTAEPFVAEPNEFQREIMGMDFETFVNETNITEIVISDFHKQFKGSREITQGSIDFGLNAYNGLRMRFDKWHKNSLNHLKFKRCECKRKAKFEDKSTETDTNTVKDSGVQCYSTDFNENASEQLEKSVAQPKVALLTVHEIGESEIILIQHNSATSDAGQNQSHEDDANITDDISMHEVSHDIANPPPPAQIASQSAAETQYDSSQSAAGSSGQEAITSSLPPQSQPILPFAEIRMSEIIGAFVTVQSQNQENLEEQNPLEIQAENVSVDEQETVMPTQSDTSVRTSQFNPEINSTPIESSANQANQLTQATQPNSEEEPTMANVKVEPQSLEYHIGDDSEVICLGEPAIQVHNISEDISSQDIFNIVEHEIRDMDENLVTVQTQPSPQISAELTRSELINVLSDDSPVIENSESPRPNSPFRNIVNIQPTVNRENAKRRKISKRVEPLSSIVPKYNYRQLNFAVRSRTGQQDPENDVWNENFSNSPQIESSPTSPDSTNYAIDESSSTDNTSVTNSNRSGKNGMTIDSSAERANLLNQDNTLFLNINTQLENDSGQIVQSSQSAATNTTTILNVGQPEEVSNVLAVPNLNQTVLPSVAGDRTEFLHHIDIINVFSNFKSVITESGNRSQQLHIETTLQHQCNGNNRIVVSDDAIKLIMKLTNREWEAVRTILSQLEIFQFDSKSTKTLQDSILHRTLYYLFKMSPKISNVNISYGDQDLETARVFRKPNHSARNTTLAIGSYVLSKMKATAQGQNNI